MNPEMWKPVVGHEGRYEVSSLGRVRSLERRVRLVSKSGTEVSRAVPERILRPAEDSAGYLSVCLGAVRSRRVHQLVLEAFVGPPEGQHALHANGDKKDNREENLRYGSRSDNMIDLFYHGHRKLDREQVLRIRSAHARGFQRNEKKALAAEMEVSLSTIQDVARRRSYTYVA